MHAAFPEVREIFFDIALAADESFSDGVVNSQYVRGPQFSADFSFDCCNKECVEGGHDITDEVADAIRHKRPTVSGERVCEGWQNEERVGSTRCHCLLRYTARIAYN
ncbi:MAG: hypothetical protein GIW99_01950 [Candidatus Eremiobacteraeota bacterium]|nr:hypothetical protein [Candidatus Eremiobacteraeota bacterium]MBC5826439.1 hypothetical protein [Candidatus Eremiobacteraeota bacterium]